MINIKPARRYAFRIGMQVAELHRGGRKSDVERVEQAFLTFMRQFDDDEQRVTKDWLVNEFVLGKRGEDALSGFVTNHDDTLTKTYSLR